MDTATKVTLFFDTWNVRAYNFFRTYVRQGLPVWIPRSRLLRVRRGKASKRFLHLASL